MIRLQELELVFGQTHARTDGGGGRTDRRGSRNSYLDIIKVKVGRFTRYVFTGVNICPLFRKFGYGTVLDFWHFSEKFFGKKEILCL